MTTSVAALAMFLSSLSAGTPTQAAPPPPAELALVEHEHTHEHQHEGIESASLMARKVAWCESGWDLTAQNPTSSASGLFQFIDGTWESVTDLPAPASDYPYSVQLRAFETLWADGAGAHHWAPSQHCWEQDEPWS